MLITAGSLLIAVVVEWKAPLDGTASVCYCRNWISSLEFIFPNFVRLRQILDCYDPELVMYFC